MEIEKQAKFALLAYQDLAQGLQSLDMTRIFYSLQSFLVASGDISKILWPSDEEYKSRGKELRDFLDVKDDSSLALREFRNHFEHFDDRLEKWIKNSTKHNFVDWMVGKKDMIKGIDPKDFFRHYDPNTEVLTFWSTPYPLGEIKNEIEQLLKKVSKETSKLPWES